MPEKPLPLTSRRKLRRQERFLKALAKTGNIREASRKTGISRFTYHEWVRDDAEFAKRAEAAYMAGESEAADRLEENLDRVGTSTDPDVFNVTAAIFRLKALRPEKYRERFEHTGAGGKPLHPAHVTVDVNVRYAEALKTLTDEELRTHNALAAKLASRARGSVASGTN